MAHSYPGSSASADNSAKALSSRIDLELKQTQKYLYMLLMFIQIYVYKMSAALRWPLMPEIVIPHSSQMFHQAAAQDGSPQFVICCIYFVFVVF